MEENESSGKTSLDAAFELAAGLFDMVPVGVRMKSPVGTFERTGPQDFAMVDGEWNRWVEGFEAYLEGKGIRLIDRRPMPVETKQAFREAGLEVHVARDT